MSQETKTHYETIKKMNLKHLPDNSKILIQRQTGGKIPKTATQFGLPFTFVNSSNKQTVWNNGPSIQLEQIPELIEMFRQVYEKYSGKDSSKGTGTFADMCVD